jgi:CHAT domain
MKPTTVLFLAANPQGTTALDLGKEAAEIAARVEPKELELVPQFAATWGTVIDALSQFKPEIVHFSGHGTPTREIILERDGKPHPIDAKIIAKLLGIKSKRPRLVVLNACYTAGIARQIRDFVDCTVGTISAVPDSTARAFAKDLYFHLSHGLSVREAVDTAKIRLEGEKNPNHQIFETEFAPGVDPAKVFLCGPRRGKHKWTLWTAIKLALAACILCGLLYVIWPRTRTVNLEFRFDTESPPTAHVAIRYNSTWHDYEVESGKLTLSLPTDVMAFDTIAMRSEGLGTLERGPYAIQSGQPVVVAVTATLGGPNRMPDISIIDDLPAPQTIESKFGQFKPQDVTLHYQNRTGRDLQLFVLDCSAYYTGEPQSGYWRAWPFPATDDPDFFDYFNNWTLTSTGWHSFVLRDLGRKDRDISLGSFQLFEQRQWNLSVTESANNRFNTQLTARE